MSSAVRWLVYNRQLRSQVLSAFAVYPRSPSRTHSLGLAGASVGFPFYLVKGYLAFLVPL